MRTLCLLAAAACVVLGSPSQAQTNQPLTNDVLINEQGMRLALVSAESLGRNDLAGDKELSVGGEIFWVLHNTSSNAMGALFSHGHMFSVELKTLDGRLIPRTEIGEKWSEVPKSLKDSYTGRVKGPWPGKCQANNFGPLTNLFRLPSNGVYVLELRSWVWQRSKKCFALSDPVRVRVIKSDPSSDEAKGSKP
jgi:hypothetical protein